MTDTATRPAMSEDHKSALAEGREQGRAVRRYLEAVEVNRPKRGRKRTPESMKKRLQVIQEELPTAEPLKRLHLIQERMDLEAELQTTEGGTGIDILQLETEFVAIAASYGARKNITYAAWRELGVPAAVLTRAGISRTTS